VVEAQIGVGPVLRTTRIGAGRTKNRPGLKMFVPSFGFWLNCGHLIGRSGPCRFELDRYWCANLV
jgi:hypothetical protein